MKLMSVLEGTWTGVPWFWSLAICKNVFYLVNVQLIWLFFQFSALPTVSGCLPFTVNTCYVTSLTKGISKQMRGFFLALFIFQKLVPPIPVPLFSFFCIPLPFILLPFSQSFIQSFSLFPSLYTLFDSLGLVTFSYVMLPNKVLNMLQVS